MHVHVFEDPGINSTLACTGVGRSIRDSRVTSIKFQNADEFVIWMCTQYECSADETLLNISLNCYLVN